MVCSGVKFTLCTLTLKPVLVAIHTYTHTHIHRVRQLYSTIPCNLPYFKKTHVCRHKIETNRSETVKSKKAAKRFFSPLDSVSRAIFQWRGLLEVLEKVKW
jgi:hypothetical protein